MSGSLVHSPADILRYLMIELGLGTLPSANGSFPVYVDQEPDKPDSAITLFDTTGRSQGKDHPTGELQRHPGIQIKVRTARASTAYTKADAIVVSLTESVDKETVSVETSSYSVQSVTVTSGPIRLGKETLTSKRNSFTINVVISLRQLS